MYYIYIVSNKYRNVLYIGVTNNLQRRLWEHINKINPDSFASKYNTYYLIYYETTNSSYEAIRREKQLKGWNRSKKDKLIRSTNPELLSLNIDILSG